ncbi:Decapping protein 2 [Carabus blaptoides fortunei]
MENKTDVVVKTVEHSIPLDVLNDLCSRFIISVPDAAKQNLVRICFQIELAHWFYLDFYCTDDVKLRSCGIKEFAAHIFQHVPFLHPHAEHVDKVLEEWREYKQSVPTYGAILLSEDLTHVLLVQSYWAKNSWGFPKGKVNEDEEPSHCAIREVLEETGFDISNSIDKNEFIESVINDQLVRLYLITGIDRNTTFQPRTRYEIKCCEWFALADLPSNKKDCTPKLKKGVSPNAFFMVLPFVKRMKRWVSDKTRANTQGRRNRNKSESESTLKTKSTKGAHHSVKGEKDEDTLRNKTLSPVRSSSKKLEKKPGFKRQLFSGEFKGILDPCEFFAPSWCNFKLDRKSILDCCP